MLSLNPDVLLLDEPTSGLDPRTQRKLIRLIQQLNEAGKTIIVATHNLDIVEEIADRALVFSEDHRLVARGSCEEDPVQHRTPGTGQPGRRRVPSASARESNFDPRSRRGEETGSKPQESLGQIVYSHDVGLPKLLAAIPAIFLFAVC